MKQNTKIHIGISSELKEVLKRRADYCSMGLAQYCRFILANTKPKVSNVEIPE